MTPSTKETLLTILFLILAIFLGATILVSLTGCATHDAVRHASVIFPHAEVDAAISSAKASQESAADQVSHLATLVTDPVAKIAVSDLQATIHDLGLKLETATGKITWYESQYDQVIGQRDWWQSQDTKDKAARIQSEKERDALIWIFAVACGSVALSTFRSALQVIQMPWQLIALAGVFACGFALGFCVGRWSLRFLAEFTPHLPF
jgi:hypothetical protein